MLTGSQLGRAIEDARKKKGVTKVALAKHFGVKPPSIQDWVKKGTIDKNKLPALWEFFAEVVPPGHWGLARYPTGYDQPDPQMVRIDSVEKDRVFGVSENTPQGRISSTTSSYAMAPGTRRSAQRQAVMLSAMDLGGSMGDGGIEQAESVVSSMAVDEAWLRRRAEFSTVENLALLTCTDDSMKPTFDKGDPLVVDRGVHAIKTEGVFVMSSKQGLLIKRVQRLPDDGWRLLSDNKKFDPIEVPSDKRSQYPVVGQVVFAWSSRAM